MIDGINVPDYLQGNIQDIIYQLQATAEEKGSPFCVYGAKLIRDGNAYLALLGDLPTGVSGVGDTPAEAVKDFNAQWHKKIEAKP